MGHHFGDEISEEPDRQLLELQVTDLFDIFVDLVPETYN